MLIKLLTLKSEFLIYIRTINDNFEESEQTNFTVDVKQKDIQQWLIEFMEKLDKLIKTVLIRFRLRGVNESSTFFFMCRFSNNLRQPKNSPDKSTQTYVEVVREQWRSNRHERISTNKVHHPEVEGGKYSISEEPTHKNDGEHNRV